MPKRFCVTGTCIPERNYMVDISGRIDRIVKEYIEHGQYFTINRARQYGKTTTLYLLERRLREKYLKWQQGKDVTFQSVILAGVYDVKTLKLKMHPQEETKYSSPWNIAVDFRIDMSFQPEDIASMLEEYEEEYQTGMNVERVSQLLYDYTDGYPYLVSKICQLTDERIAGTQEFPEKSDAWKKEGILAAIKLLLKEPNTLFDDMTKKLLDYPQLKEMLQNILFGGVDFPYKRETPVIDLGTTFGFLKDENGVVVVANRIFETQMYDMFLAEMAVNNQMYLENVSNRSQFIVAGMLQMDLVMKKFYEYYEEVYAEQDSKFIEENGRKLFLLYLKPIINGTGNYYIEARTRNNRRTDIIVDYKRKRFIIELKIWHGQEYHARGEKQIFDYLEYYQEKKGYLLSFNFNKNKKTGIKELEFQGKRILEVVV